VSNHEKISEILDRSDLDEAQKLALTRQASPEGFSEATFMATVKGARIQPGGDMDVTLSVPQADKYRAFPVTDAVGIMVVVRVSRKKRGEKSL